MPSFIRSSRRSSIQMGSLKALDPEIKDASLIKAMKKKTGNSKSSTSTSNNSAKKRTKRRNSLGARGLLGMGKRKTSKAAQEATQESVQNSPFQDSHTTGITFNLSDDGSDTSVNEIVTKAQSSSPPSEDTENTVTRTEGQVEKLLEDMRRTMDDLATKERDIRKRCRVHTDRAQARFNAGNTNGAILSLNKLYATKIDQFRAFQALALVRKLEVELHTQLEEKRSRVLPVRWHVIKFGHARADPDPAENGIKKNNPHMSVERKYVDYQEQVDELLKGKGEAPEQWEDKLREDEEEHFDAPQRGISRGVSRADSLMANLKEESYSTRSLSTNTEDSTRSLKSMQEALRQEVAQESQGQETFSSRSLGTIARVKSNRHLERCCSSSSNEASPPTSKAPKERSMERAKSASHALSPKKKRESLSPKKKSKSSKTLQRELSKVISTKTLKIGLTPAE